MATNDLTTEGQLSALSAAVKADVADKAGTTHAANHATGGSDALTPAQIGASSTGHTHAGGGSTDLGAVPLESFAGATDDDKLTAAMAQISGETYKRSIALYENRVYNFNISRNVYDGFKVVGPPGFGNQYRGALSTQQRVDINIPGGAWLNLNQSQTFDVYVGGLSFYSQSSTCDFFAGHASNVLWTSVFRDLGFSLFRHVFGSPGQKSLMTAVQFDGWWNVNNGRDIAFRIGGSDNVFWAGSNCLLDSPTSQNGAIPHHFRADYLGKTVIGPMFITGEQEPGPIRVDGSGNTNGLIFHGTRAEGRNAGASSYGSVVRHTGGTATYRDCWISYGYSDPASSGRPSEGGVVSVLGGDAYFDGCAYARANGVATSVPWIYATGAGTVVTVKNARKADESNPWGTDKPVVRAVNGAVAVVDDSVTLVTV